MPAANLENIDLDVVKMLPYHFAKRHGVIIAYKQNGHLEAWTQAEIGRAHV